jgi:hypothetical protein
VAEAGGASPPPAAPSARVEGAARLALEEERGFLLRSLEDLDAELAAGDIAGADYEMLRDRYTARAAAVLRALEGAAGRDEPDAGPADAGEANAADAGEANAGEANAAEAGPASPPPPSSAPASPPPGTLRRWRRLLLWGAVALFAAAAVALVAAELAVRLPGQTSSGSLELSGPQQVARALAQAQALELEGRDSQALVLYHQVLVKDPDQQEALAESGWLEFEAGVLARKPSLLEAGQAEEERAERVGPGAFAPHLYLGSMLLVEGQPAQAADQFSQFLADHPPPAEEHAAWPYVVRAFTQAGRAVPPAPPGVGG